MTRALIVSRYFPFNPRADVSGVSRRLRVFARAIAGLVSELDLLFFVPPTRDLSPAATSGYERIAAEYVGKPINLFLAPWRAEQPRATMWSEFLPGLFTFLAQTDFRRTSSEPQVRVLERCL